MPCRFLSFCFRGFCLHPSSSRLRFTRGVGPSATRATSLKFCSSFYGTTGVTSLKSCSGFLWSDWGDLAQILF